MLNQKRFSVFSLSAVLIASASVLLMSPSASCQQKDLEKEIDRYLSSRTELGRYSGAVLIGRNGKVLLRKGYGFADVEKKTPYTPNTQHEVASISKMFTSMAALKLRDQHRLQLSDSICKYLEDCPESWQPVTIQHLMRHASGIPDYEEKLDLGSDKYVEFMTRRDASAEVLADAKKLPLDFKPGEKFHYSNTGYVVLSYVVQAAAKQPFAEFVTKSLLRPAGMKHSGVFGFGKWPQHLANGYTHGDIGWDKMLAGVALTAGHLKKVKQLSLTPPAGDAGIYSTIDDLYRWSELMDGSPLIPASEAAEVFTPSLGGYGYGWFIDRSFERARLSHTGSFPGYSTDIIKFPDDKITIVVFSNLDRARMSRIRRDLSAIVLGQPYDLPVQGQLIKLTPEQLTRLEGNFKMNDGAVLTIRNDPDYLTAEIQGRFAAGLIPLSPTEFYVPLTDGKAIFELDANGRAFKVNLRYGGENHLADRIAP